jgi:leader peptidase (prepilin peptidase)/N-methyltransferase
VTLAPLVTIYVFVVGACVGSFLNVVIARVPAGRSVVTPPSSCPRCSSRIAWYDNIPLVSWVVLRAKCRRCGLPISARYPLVELLTAVVVVAVWLRYGPQWATAGYAVFAAALIALAWIDLDTWLLPHQITWPLLAVGMLSPLWNAGSGWPDALIGAAAGFGVLAAIALFGEKVLKRETMGWGDVWLLAGIGAWLGWRGLLPVLMLASVQGAVGGILLLLLHKRPPAPSAAANPAAATANDDDWVPPPHAVPFGPFLALGALEFLLLGDWLIEAWARAVQGIVA